jgi:hypothetical protein
MQIYTMLKLVIQICILEILTPRAEDKTCRDNRTRNKEKVEKLWSGKPRVM